MEQGFSTRSVGMNLARPPKAGIEKVFWICVASATIEQSTVADATKSCGRYVIPALRGWAKLNRRSATKTVFEYPDPSATSLRLRRQCVLRVPTSWRTSSDNGQARMSVLPCSFLSRLFIIHALDPRSTSTMTLCFFSLRAFC